MSLAVGMLKMCTSHVSLVLIDAMLNTLAALTARKQQPANQVIEQLTDLDINMIKAVWLDHFFGFPNF